LGGLAKKKAVQLTQKVVNQLIKMSPVYTGNFRASWTVSENTPNYFAAQGGSPVSPLAAPTIKVVALADFPVFYIVNGQPYAKRLEEGWSKQAPLGLVRVTIASLR
jgi:hypothetical protein